MRWPRILPAEEALEQITQDHLDGWEQAEFEDPERILGCQEFSLRRIKVPRNLKFPATHPPVVATYRGLKTPVPPPFFDANGLVIDGTHRLEANAGRTLKVYVPTSYLGPLRMGNSTPLSPK